MKGGKGDEVGFFLCRIGWCESQKGVADLLYVDCARKGSFLSVVTLQLKDGVSTLELTKWGCVLTCTLCSSFHIQYAVAGGWWLTCSETKCVVPDSSSHFPRKSSPRNGFNGFFSLPNFSLRDE